ncbi:uncharacterized protein LOC107876786 [Capsicum annuum]|uniref:uncharacterized protein LOC107876786 n=1 Tax=Capsicum annuum TaxID=4072 RepID=UPI001FB13817|nr:uncharacterized protein LOC107876786 [Capsicum annuum]
MASNSTPGTSATATTSNVPVPVVLPYAKPFPDVSNIEIFANENLKSCKEGKVIWEALIKKFTAEDVTKQKFVVGKFYNWQMSDVKEIKIQINEYQNLLEDLKAKDITLPEKFVAGVLIEKLPESWNDYKNNLKHKQTNFTIEKIINHILIEDTNRNESFKSKQAALNANLVQGQHSNNRRYRIRNNKEMRNPPKANLAERDEIIAAVISEVNMVAHIKEWSVDSGATRHICTNREAFAFYTSIGDDSEVVYLGYSRTAKVLGKGKVLLKLTSGKTLALMDVLHVPTMQANLISVALLDKVGMKVFTKLYLLRNKDDVFDDFVSYKSEIENQLSREIKRIRSDRGGEYVSLNAFCEK